LFESLLSLLWSSLTNPAILLDAARPRRIANAMNMHFAAQWYADQSSPARHAMRKMTIYRG
jgi:hypothetical protein